MRFDLPKSDLRHCCARLIVALIASLTVCGCSSVAESKPNQSLIDQPIDGRPTVQDVLLNAMEQELNRSMKHLKTDDYPAPYYIAYRIFDTEEVKVYGKYGAIASTSAGRNRMAYAEVRVGDYDFDNYANISSQSFRLGGSEDPTIVYDSDIDAVRGTLWLLTDQNYKEATAAFLTKKGDAIFATEEKRKQKSFSRSEPIKARIEVKPFTYDVEKWKKLVSTMTDKFKEKREVSDAIMTISGRNEVRYLVTSEGSQIVEPRTIYAIHMTATALAEDGMPLELSRSFYSRSEDEMPSEKELSAAVDEMAASLGELKKAPIMDPFTGPAILMPEAAGVLFHEAVGHRLEGERQLDEEEGQTFAGRIGQQVVPKFLSVYDDPTVTQIGDTKLNGTYAYDEEGIKALRANLIEKGDLKGFLMSRTPVDSFEKSNGHGRASGVNKPMARMANLIVESEKSHQMSEADLKAALIAEVKRQKKPYGLIIRDITGGSTNTSGYGYQAFKGSPQLLYRVDPETGNEELVRGVELVGTPLTSISKIVAAGDTPGVFNGYCGAESGWVPVSAVSPALLTTEIELQRTQGSKIRPPILPAPWIGEEKGIATQTKKSAKTTKTSRKAK